MALLLAGAMITPSLMPSATYASAAATTTESTTPSENFLEARQYHIDNARLPGQASIRQSVTAWQISSGQWNGQSLAGLCVVLVQSTPEDGHGVRQTNCYISHIASSAQRDALLSAFMASQPQFFSTTRMQNMRIEPATINIELDGNSVMLHLGLIA
jgi:hypothetical protein